MLWERCPAIPLLALQHVSSATLSVSGRSQVTLYSCVPFQPVWFNTAIAQRLQLAQEMLCENPLRIRLPDEPPDSVALATATHSARSSGQAVLDMPFRRDKRSTAIYV